MFSLRCFIVKIYSLHAVFSWEAAPANNAKRSYLIQVDMSKRRILYMTQM